MLIGQIFLDEKISETQSILGGLILIEALAMGFVSKKSSFSGTNVPKGLFFSILFGLFLGTGFSMVGVISKRLNPILTGYIWEFGVGMTGMTTYLLISYLKNLPVRLKTRDFYRVGLASTPTIAGTFCYAKATTLGPIGILAAILATLGAVTGVLGYLILKEKLSFKQWIILGVLVATLAFLKLVSA